jgi:enoyl-CoA hydratase/3-hydroxyacyl-CoA dehydrogenase
MHLNELLIKANRLGQKTGAGYYRHDPKTGKSTPSPEIANFVQKARELAGNPTPIQGLTDQQIVEYLLFPVVNEACRIIEEGHVYRVSDVDVACTMGMSFPRFYGGLIKWADSIGAKHIVDTLDRLRRESGLKIFEPCNYLRQCARNNASLYSIDSQLRNK